MLLVTEAFANTEILIFLNGVIKNGNDLFLKPVLHWILLLPILQLYLENLNSYHKSDLILSGKAPNSYSVFLW